MFTKVITLTEERRQVVAVEDVNQQQFINTLLNVRNGKCTLEDWRFLQTRTKGRVVDFETRFIDALRLFASNEKVNESNTKKLQVTLLHASYNSTNRAARATENLKRPDFLISHNDEQLNRFRQMVSDGEAAEDRVIKYADTLQTAINPKTDQQAENCVPDLLIHAQLTLLLRSVTLTQWTPITKKFAIVYNVISVVQMDIANPKLVENVDSITHFQTSRNPALSLSQLAEQDQSKPIVHKRNDPFLNVHNRVMLEHWRANVDLQLILDSHAAITYMTKYAAKGEKAGRSLQTIVKTVVQKGNATDNASTAIRSAIVRSVGNRDIGQGET